jgi:hypothetical protein
MSLESVRQYFIDRQINMPIFETQESTATVALAAQAHGVEPGRIAKNIGFSACKRRCDYLGSQWSGSYRSSKIQSGDGQRKNVVSR